MTGRHGTVAERFWAKVEPEPMSGCWLWTASTTTHGYGQLRGVSGENLMAHRVAYELVVGSVPDGLQLDHLCRNRACCAPDHLQPVTGRVNTLRGLGPSAKHALKTECPMGHPYDEANTAITRRGTRDCRACNRMRMAEQRRKP